MVIYDFYVSNDSIIFFPNLRAQVLFVSFQWRLSKIRQFLVAMQSLQNLLCVQVSWKWGDYI